ncbi:MAG: nucleoside triphosphate pyrophosphohydrolase [Cellulosilyticaceae bacterium]
MKENQYTYEELVQIIATLRGENGCSWDKEQTHESLKEHILEESYELVEAINNTDIINMKEELGDVLLQVLMHTQIAKELGEFTLEDVVDGIASKLVYRHPHIFNEHQDIDSEKVILQWDELKAKEKKHTSQTESMLSVAKALPALTRTNKVVGKAKKIGFFWDAPEPIIDKVKEELEEVENELKNQDLEALEEEIGDLLLSIVNLSNFLEINPEFALTKSLEKFINRFRYIENSAFAMRKQLSEMTLQEMDSLWNKCKNNKSQN